VSVRSDSGTDPSSDKASHDGGDSRCEPAPGRAALRPKQEPRERPRARSRNHASVRGRREDLNARPHGPRRRACSPPDPLPRRAAAGAVTRAAGQSLAGEAAADGRRAAHRGVVPGAVDDSIDAATGVQRPAARGGRGQARRGASRVEPARRCARTRGGARAQYGRHGGPRGGGSADAPLCINGRGAAHAAAKGRAAGGHGGRRGAAHGARRARAACAIGAGPQGRWEARGDCATPPVGRGRRSGGRRGGGGGGGAAEPLLPLLPAHQD
jgi:hypothetical protein